MTEITRQVDNNSSKKLLVDIHQVPKSIPRFLLLSLQHIFAMFGANILVPIIVNQQFNLNGGLGELIPIQLAFLGSGVGTIIYLICTGFRVPIYLGSSFAFMGVMGTMYAQSGYSTYVSLMLVGMVYMIVAFIFKMTNTGKLIKKMLPPIVIGPAIMMIGINAISSGAINDFGLTLFNSTELGTNRFEIAWLFIGIATFTFMSVVISMLCFKNFLKVIPILIGLIFGSIFALILFGILKACNNPIALQLFNPSANASQLLNPSQWKWYPDITSLWTNTTIQSSYNKPFEVAPILAILPLSLVTIAEHIGDHINIGSLTNNDFIQNKPGLHRTILGDGLATMVAVSFGGVPNTSYGENTSVISISKVASVWVIFTAAILAIVISFIAPISALIQAIPKPVLGGIEAILFSMIAVNGLKLLIENKVDMFRLKNIVILSIMLLFSLAGSVGAGLRFFEGSNFNVEITGTGLAVLIGLILNLILPDEKNDDKNKPIYTIDFSPADFKNFILTKNKKNKKETVK